MNSVVLLVLGFIILILGYLFYGRWLAKTWGIDPKRKTPAHTKQDGMDYVPAKAPVLMGHHFSSIAGAGPINGPIQAAVFGWVPVLLWVLIGGIFIGAVHDFGALFASIRHGGASIGEVIASSVGKRAKRFFIIFSWLALILVIAAFGSIVAGTFKATFTETGAVDTAASTANASTAMISILFILISIAFGFFVYRKNANIVVSSVVGVIAIILCLAIGINFHPIYLDNTTWMIVVGIYILIASVTPVWILLQPRDYLSSFLLYGLMALAIIGIIGAHPNLNIPAFTSFKDEISVDVLHGSANLGYLFPALFVTIACGAISGFHSLISSGTTSKQLDNEKHALPIAYGSMLIECALAIISLCALSYVWEDVKLGVENGGLAFVPTTVFAGGIAKMLSTIPGLENTYSTAYSLLVLAVSVFCLTSLDTAARLARYMFQEFWLDEGQTYKDVTGVKKILANPLAATAISVVLGIALGLTGYAKIWSLFGASNQLLAALALLAVAVWLGKEGKKNKMLFVPMVFMLIVTIVALVQAVFSNIGQISAGTDGVWPYVRAILAFLLVVLAIILAIESFQALKKQSKTAK
ncbi:MAG: carbon starvation protein A [Clostridiales bacterium]|nr:carbon starvation protein A [Clostridiales bacterium]